MDIHVLGCSGGIGDHLRTTSFLLDQHTLIDAGTGVGDLDLATLAGIDRVFLTHAHMDHTCMLPMLVDAAIGLRHQPVKVYATNDTIHTLKTHLFNHALWPDFSSVPSPEAPFLEFVPFNLGDEYQLDANTCIRPVPAVHSIPAVGYAVTSHQQSWVFSGDTKGGPDFWHAIRQLPGLRWLVIETSFTNHDQSLADISGHLCPDSLLTQLDQLPLQTALVITHLKPGEEELIMQELRASGSYTGDITALHRGHHFNLGHQHASLTLSVQDESKWLERLNRIGTDLSAERNLATLLERILLAAKEFSGADGGTVYRVVDHQLQFETLRNDSLGFAMGGTTGTPIPFPAIPLEKDGQPNHHHVVAHAALAGRTINIEDAYTAEGYDFSGTRAFDAQTGYRSQSFLTVPMKDHDDNVIGVLQLINAKHPLTQRIIGFSAAKQQQVESLASQAAIALSNRLLIDQLETLFESLITLINTALDEKSPYTGGHCARVPELTMLLADATDRIQSGPLKDFQLSEKDRYELKIASLLHDCGKITTPVHIVDKASKLEAIHDRIEVVNSRFDMLCKDLEIACLKGQITEEEARAQQARLNEDRQLIERCNRGGEWMSDEAIAGIQRIASQVWTDRDGNPQPLLTADEVTSLCVRKGTLTDAERNIINHHIVVTINMLEALPWPPHLAKVPEYAGGHHERMDGKGYPKGLKREEMSLQARMMGIADIFEALTAADRPYKPGLTLSTALKILGKMTLDQHIDPDLFDVFMTEKVYQTYADQFLPPHQIDRIDDTQIPGWSGYRQPQ
ncbi:HD domain-containing phosphohydrolase [Leeia oryzae]|uniref:HD domain-containing phosphohydrolase n=1 Tax=Leeia oryzae TaxID=356662 RepID=UPI0003603899|nr:HD domain-containing phosphohydrolase [Leeia oryzae]